MAQDKNYISDLIIEFASVLVKSVTVFVAVAQRVAALSARNLRLYTFAVEPAVAIVDVVIARLRRGWRDWRC